jgi:hypothetical protein
LDNEAEPVSSGTDAAFTVRVTGPLVAELPPTEATK